MMRTWITYLDAGCVQNISFPNAASAAALDEARQQERKISIVCYFTALLAVGKRFVPTFYARADKALVLMTRQRCNRCNSNSTL